ncbi:MAG: hypothetical protein DRO88_00265 [Promethearchaeia archaeon]|nr:MAG: hypothetical protein DRO88_00265 [Candidatus Lokiarchaeia archaeon]
MNSQFKFSKPVWAQAKEELLKNLQSKPKHGLKSTDAKRRLEIEGVNELPPPKVNFFRIYLAPLFNWLIVVYLIAALIMFIFGIITGEGNMTMIYTTLAIVGLNCVVAVVQQARAVKKLRALQALAAHTCIVIRDSVEQEISSSKLVPGDVVLLETGNRVPADCRILEATNLQVDESSLTGESELVSKNSGEALSLTLLSSDLPLQTQYNILFFGTYISSGRARVLVYATGVNTELGRISEQLKQQPFQEIPIQKKLNNIGKWFALGVIGFWAMVLLILWISTGKLEIIKSLNSAMDIMPINIPLLTTVVMLTGTLAMANHGVIVRNLTSVESLGRISVLCTDKTGTLTRGEMCVQHIWTRGSHFKVTGSGYIPKGEIFLFDNPQNPQKLEDIHNYPHLQLLLANCTWNNNAKIQSPKLQSKKETERRWSIIGSPTEGALAVLVNKLKNIRNFSEMENFLVEKVHEYEFSSQLKRMSTIVRTDSDSYLCFTKGASEIVMGCCNWLLAEENEAIPLIDELRLVILNRITEFEQQGYRVLSFAYKKLKNIDYESLDTAEIRDSIESDLIFIGFVAIMDLPREGVQEAIHTCYQMGIETVVITGDSLPTATAIGQQIGLRLEGPKSLHSGRLSNSKGKEEIPINENIEDISSIKIFARVSPLDKQFIVEKYHEHSKIVAMTGDGVNDALALHDADVGVAMGIQGTDIAKEAADMILSDDNFVSMVEGIKQGRGIFANIRSLIFFFVCINLFEGIVQFLLAVILDLPYFLSEDFYYQWVFLSLTVHMFPGLMLTFDNVSNDVVYEKPRNSQEIISRNVLILLLVYGILLICSMLAVYFLVYSETYSKFLKKVFPSLSGLDFGNLNQYFLFTPETQDLWQNLDFTTAKTLTMLMVVLFLCETFLALQIRRPNKSLWKSIKQDLTKTVILVISLLYGLFLFILYMPGFQIWLINQRVALNFVALNIVDWMVCIVISFTLCILPFEGVKYFYRRHADVGVF